MAGRGFAADMMLGRLARWMRLLGYDVLYRNPVGDAELIRLARAQDRVLLTRDTRLVRRCGVGEHLLLSENDPMEQLGRVVVSYPPDPHGFLSRCAHCNARLRACGREAVRDRVPEHVYLSCSRFAACPECGRVYWPGSHLAGLVERSRALLGGRGPEAAWTR